MGNPVAMNLGNGLVPTTSYDEANRVATLAVPGIAALTYAYDAAGNILSITDGVNATSSKSYGYDPLDRLADATGLWSALTWRYDANGNRL